MTGAHEQYRHACEVRDCIRRFFPRGEAMAAHLEMVERRRGKVAAERLRADVRLAWREAKTKGRAAA